MSVASYSFLNNDDELYFIPLGGAEQFGVNLNVYASGGELLAIDCGIGFADERMPGIDIILPDPQMLEDNRGALAGMIITHAHEDHIGAVAHLWERFKCPLYASEFTAKILRLKLNERNLKHAEIIVIDAMETAQIGRNFNVQFIPVAHSIPDAMALVIDTPQGRVMHSGDWNLDPAPVVGEITDPERFKAIGDQGVLAYIGDSTNAQSDGYSGSESDVAAGLAQEFKAHKGRIIISSFSSNIGRIKSIMRAAKDNDRDVSVIGRSLHRMIGAATECGYLDDVPGLIPEGEIGSIPDDKIVVIVTGSQGEGRAALAKIARGDHRSLSLNPGDTVIFSARAIPGNEKDINHIKNMLRAGRVNVVSPGDNTEHQIHVSGHPCRDEIAQMLSWVRPHIVVPVHGERMQTEAQGEFAKSCQVPHVLVPQNGSVVFLASGKGNQAAPKTIDHLQTGILAVDAKRVIKSDHVSIIERRKLQYSGVIHASVVLDKRGEVLGEPKLESSGLIDPKDKGELQIEDTLFDEMLDVLEDASKDQLLDDEFISEEIRIALRRLCHQVLGIKPKTNVHVMRV